MGDLDSGASYGVAVVLVAVGAEAGAWLAVVAAVRAGVTPLGCCGVSREFGGHLSSSGGGPSFIFFTILFISGRSFASWSSLSRGVGAGPRQVPHSKSILGRH